MISQRRIYLGVSNEHTQLMPAVELNDVCCGSAYSIPYIGSQDVDPVQTRRSGGGASRGAISGGFGTGRCRTHWRVKLVPYD